jgi:dihydrodipicolinate synthase/N-acetylneuraminate lyase
MGTTQTVRVLAAITTPFTTTEDVHVGAFGAHVEWLISSGLDGVFVGGTTGEGAQRVIAQVGRPSTRATVLVARRALAAGAGTAAAYVPWFFPAEDEQVRDHLTALLETAQDEGRPAFAYTIPRRHHNVLRPAVLGELARAGLAGLKESTGDADCHREFVAAVAGLPFELYCATEPLVLDATRTGACGAITGAAGCRPELFVALRDAVATGDDAAAERAQAAITDEKDAIEAEGQTVRSVKRRVRQRLAEEGIDYRAEPRAPFR